MDSFAFAGAFLLILRNSCDSSTLFHQWIWPLLCRLPPAYRQRWQQPDAKGRLRRHPYRAVNRGGPDAVVPRSHKPWQPRRVVASPLRSQQERCPHPPRCPARRRPMDCRGRPLQPPPRAVADWAERHASRNHDRCNRHQVGLVRGLSPCGLLCAWSTGLRTRLQWRLPAARPVGRPHRLCLCPLLLARQMLGGVKSAQMGG